MYVYGIVRGDAAAPLPEKGVDGRRPRPLRHGELAALVSDVGEGPVRPNRRNVMAHSKVLQAVVAAGTDVLPMQFGVVMPSADAVCDELIAAHAEILLAQLDEHAGRVELDVTVTAPQDVVLRDVLERDARLAEAGRRLRAAGDAAGYHQRIEFGEAVAAAIEAERARTAAELMARLGPLAVDAAVDEPRHEDMLASVAFLVERRRLDAFDAKLDALGGERRVRCVGPLPAYHFVELVLDQEAGAWA